jgi:ABC-2 type transport system ATP-binding protein
VGRRSDDGGHAGAGDTPVREHERAAIEIEDLVVSYGRKLAVDGLSLTVPVGSVYGFLGPNGAGKTTTIKTLLGFRRPDGGSARVLGYDIVEESIEVRARVGFASEVNSLYEGMTVPQICAFCRDVSRSWDQALVERYLGVFGVPEEIKVRKLSKGQKAQLQLYLALGSNPEVLILDEPTSGLDPVTRRAFLKVLVGEVASEGRTEFFSTHLLSDIEAVADAVGIIKNGRLVVSGDLHRLREMHRVFRLTYVEPPPEEEVRALRSLPGVLDAEREGRGVRLRARAEDVESVTLAARERPYAVRDVEVYGLSLEDIFVWYIEEDGDDR